MANNRYLKKFLLNPVALFYVLLISIGLNACSSGNSDSRTESMADTSVSQTQDKPSGGQYLGSFYDRVKQEVRDITIFGVKTTSQELEAAKALAKAGILSIDTIHEKDGKFTGAVVEFAGVKFGMNRGFIFITSRHDKAAVKSLVKTISKYYGEPEIEGDESEPEYCYYIWDSPNAPYIRIRPLHSEEGGLTMLWGI